MVSRERADVNFKKFFTKSLWEPHQLAIGKDATLHELTALKKRAFKPGVRPPAVAGDNVVEEKASRAIAELAI